MKKASSEMICKVKEIVIPTPYGKLAAKAWGNKTGKPVLALHGRLGSSATFDNLIPLLKNQLYIVAVDAPGSGMSSHKPRGGLYFDFHNLLEYRRAIDYLGWTKFDILGFSLGAEIGLLFSSIFPDMVKKMVAFDRYRFSAAPLLHFPEITISHVNTYLDLENKWLKPPRKYTYEEARERLRNDIIDKISIDIADVLLKRCLIPTEYDKGFIYSRDFRTRNHHMLNLKDVKLMNRYLSRVKCELMLIMATEGNAVLNYYDGLDRKEKFEIFRKNTKKFVVEYVDGTHFNLVEYPERVSPLINNFLCD